MAQIKTFRELIVWQKAHTLVIEVYKITEIFPKHELFSLVNQIRRAAVSIAANIVEGFKRKGLKDSLNFYNTAEASLEEVKYFLLLSRDLNYINESKYKKIFALTEEIGRLLCRWIQSQRIHLT